ncbi:MAG: diguanylate cyclase [Eubacterium sp.]|nr:diguanylate cyclase [Eubacterium sp.]
MSDFASRRKKILVIDDESMFLKVARHILEEYYIVLCARSGEEGLSIMRREDPDLIMVDIKMPGMSGFEFFNMMKNLAPEKDIPVIFMTANDGHEMEAQSLEMGADDYITKPFVPAVMLSRVDSVLARKDKMMSLEVSATTDSLTGVWNRVALSRKFREMISAYKRVAVIMTDMDNFKSVNDRFGHEMGNRILVEYTRCLERLCDGNGVVGRMGGDEFALCIPIMSLDEVFRFKCVDAMKEITARINGVVGRPEDGMLSLSGGIAIYPRDGEDFDTLMDKADKALYYIKEHGKSAVKFYYECTDDIKMDRSQEEAPKSSMEVFKENVLTAKFPPRGAFDVDFNDFKNLYSFLSRNADRGIGDCLLMKFKLNTPEDEKSVEQGLRTPAQRAFFEAALPSLRKGDVGAFYGDEYFLILLFKCGEADADTVAERILASWEKTDFADRVTVTYEYEMIK